MTIDDIVKDELIEEERRTAYVQAEKIFYKKADWFGSTIVMPVSVISIFSGMLVGMCESYHFKSAGYSELNQLDNLATTLTLTGVGCFLTYFPAVYFGAKIYSSLYSASKVRKLKDELQ